MSKFYEAVTSFEQAINSYSEGLALKEVILTAESFDKIRWVVIRELEMQGSMRPSGDAFGFEGLRNEKLYFKCRGIKFIKELKEKANP